MSRKLLVAAATGLAAILLFRVVATWTMPAASLAALTPDDAYYYFQVAQNVARGNGFSFDGLRPTNGYHPLWMMVCAAIAQIQGADVAPASLTLYVRLMLTIQLLFGGTAAALLAYAVGRGLRSANAAAIVLAGFATPWLVYASSDGLESGASLLAMSALFLAALRDRPFTSDPRKEDLAFGALLSIGFLARLDYAFLCVGVALIATARACGLPAGKRLIWLVAKGFAWGAPVVALAAVYLLLNRMRFDTTMPISGAIKSTFPEVHFQAKWLLQHIAPMGAGAAGVAITALLWTRRGTWPDGYAMLACGSAFILLHSIYALLFVHWAVHAWHFTGFWPVALVAAAWAIGEVVRARLSLRWLPALAVAGALLIGVAGQWRFFHGRSDLAFQARSYDAAQWARGHIPQHEIVGMSDCGTFGFYRGNLVVNLDGVVNDRAYQDALVSEGLAKYLADREVGFIAHHAVDTKRVAIGYDKYEYNAYSRLYRKPGGSIVLRERDEIYRSTPYDDGTGLKVFVIWRVPGVPNLRQRRMPRGS